MKWYLIHLYPYVGKRDTCRIVEGCLIGANSAPRVSRHRKGYYVANNHGWMMLAERVGNDKTGSLRLRGAPSMGSVGSVMHSLS